MLCLGGVAPTPARAETTDLAVIGCEFVANAIDGNVSDVITNADVAAACGGEDAYGVPTALPPTSSPGSPSIANLAQVIGDQDGILEKSDFSGGLVDARFDDNQLGVHCVDPGATVTDVAFGFACTLDVFVFLNDEAPVKLDLPSGLQSLEGGALDFTCIADGAQPPPATPVTAFDGFAIYTTGVPHGLTPGDVIVSGGQQYVVVQVTSPTGFTVEQGAIVVGGGTTVSRLYSMTSDNDCADGTNAALGVDHNGDGVVLFHLLAGTARAGDTKQIFVSSEAVEQTADINIVGPPSDVILTLAENLIETNNTAGNVAECKTQTPYSEAISPPTSTVARAIVTDADGMPLTRTAVVFSITLPAATAFAQLATGDPAGGIISNTFFSVASEGVPIAAWAAVAAA